MRRESTIILLVLWVCSLIEIKLSVDHYIERKKTRLRSEIRENIDSLFEGQSSADPLVTLCSKETRLWGFRKSL